MHTYCRRATSTVFACLAMFVSASANGPDLINFQGQLTNPAGSPLAGTFAVQFKLYDAPTAGTLFWQETQAVTTNTNGFFAVLLGSVNPLRQNWFEVPDLYLGIKVQTDPELSPRSRLASTPWAHRVNTLAGALGGAITGPVHIYSLLGGDGLTSDGSYSVTANHMTGVRGSAEYSTAQNVGVFGLAYDANATSNSAGIYGVGISRAGGTIWAGYFEGWVNVTGSIYAGAKFFKIDHPADPARKTLQHACVESDEYKNVYDGMVTTDDNGMATVDLPDWFESLNKDFRYQLTVIGQFAQAIVASEVHDHRFGIQSDKPHVKISWQVTGVRKDAFALAHAFAPEAEKPRELQGLYLHPVELGKSETLGVDYAVRQYNLEQRESAERTSGLDLAPKQAGHK